MGFPYIFGCFAPKVADKSGLSVSRLRQQIYDKSKYDYLGKFGLFLRDNNEEMITTLPKMHISMESMRSVMKLD